MTTSSGPAINITSSAGAGISAMRRGFGLIGQATTSAFSPALIDNLALWLDAQEGVTTGGARKFTAADKAELLIADNAALSASASSFTIATWVYTESGVTYGIASKTGEWDLYVNGNVLRFLVYGTGSTVEVSTPMPGTNAWHLIIATIDVAGDLKPTLYVDNGAAIQGSAISGTTRDLTGNFHIGMLSNFYLNGRLSRMGFWKRVLTSAERAFLYNSGNGRSYGELGEAGTDGSALTTSLQAYWNLNEAGSAAQGAIDAHGSNDLTFTNTELLSNAGFETAGAGGADVFASWGELTAGTGTIADEGTIVDAGSHAVKLTAGTPVGTNYAAVYQSVLTSGQLYNYSVRARHNGSAASLRIYLNTLAGMHSLTSSYATYSGTGTATGVFFTAYNHVTDAGVIYADTVSVKAASIPAANGPVSSRAADSSGNGNHGTLTGFSATQELTAWKTDVPAAIGEGYSLDFDGVSNYVTGAISLSAPFTFSTWVESVSGLNSSFLRVDNGADSYRYELTLTGASGLVGFTGRHNNTSNGVFSVDSGFTLVSTGGWHHVVGVLDSLTGLPKIYIDGVLAATGSASTLSGASNITAVDLGRGNSFCQCSLADSRIYDVALSDAQVAELYAGSEATGATPVAHYAFDDGPQSSEVTDGDPVLNWEDQSTNRYLAQQVTAASRPTYVASAINGKPALRFDGVDDWMQAVFGATLTQPNTVFIVGKASASTQAFTDGIDSSNRHDIGRNAADKWQMFAGTGLASTSSPDANNHLIMAMFNGASSVLEVDGAQVAAGDAGAHSLTGITIGAKYVLSSFLNGDIAEIIIIDGEASAADIANVESYVNTKYGITIA